MDKVKEVKALHEKGYSNRKIADETGYTKLTIKKYLSPNFNPIKVNMVFNATENCPLLEMK
ncbi:hypothetical protein CSV80_11980 [Sporosarcina sp. P12(2017)]|uniref:helix-turn-helix domain-containing protein n=1 Tax=unclassified Sporosarcina TaxID=2647733 RepID=UPI000C1654D7|nr:MULTISPECIES: helix-turn-helix domain-containing protein [unclassified Sporosarcina]PIC56946.1 hypothetical protein CSV81_11180 [Sporosarcina sp. P10]PIC60137.1 hypothetical protein CSV80_11980 [Sporosarcina sp. P12(2017)]